MGQPQGKPVISASRLNDFNLQLLTQYLFIACKFQNGVDNFTLWEMYQ